MQSEFGLSNRTVNIVSLKKNASKFRDDKFLSQTLDLRSNKDSPKINFVRIQPQNR